MQLKKIYLTSINFFEVVWTTNDHLVMQFQMSEIQASFVDYFINHNSHNQKLKRKNMHMAKCFDTMY